MKLNIILLNTAISPQTIIASAILIQVCYVIISVIGLRFIYNRSRISQILLWYSVVSTLLLLLSNPFLLLTKPLISIGWSFSQNTSLLLVFLTNIVFLTIIIQFTGRVLHSIYTHTLTVLPALAIFLQEPVWKITLYTFLIALFYSTSSYTYFFTETDPWPNEERNRRGFIFISTSSLLLSALIGILTK